MLPCFCHPIFKSCRHKPVSNEKASYDPLMGWWGSSDVRGQVRLLFDTQEQAVAYAEANGVPFDLEAPPETKPIKPKAYADNFRYGRSENWTH